MPLPRFSLALIFALCFSRIALSAEPKPAVIAEIDRGILELLPQAEGNFPRIKPLIEAARAPAWVVHTATPVPALHASVYMIKTIIETHRRLYAVQYQGKDAVAAVTAAVRGLTRETAHHWDVNGESPANPQKWELNARQDGVQLVKLSLNPADATAILTIGVFESATVSVNDVSAKLDDLVAQAEKEFEKLPRGEFGAGGEASGQRSAPAATILRADEALFYKYDTRKYYPSYNAYWYTSNPSFDSLCESMFTYLDQLVVSGRGTKINDVRGQSFGRETREMTVQVGSIYITCSPISWKAGVEVTVGRPGIQPGYHPFNNAPISAGSSSGSTPAAAQSAPVSRQRHMCVRCDGHGTIEHNDRYGHLVRDSCPICGGKGYTE